MRIQSFPIIFFLFFFIVPIIFGDIIKFARIKIVLGEQRLVLEERDNVPQMNEWLIQPATILSYLSVQLGDELTEERLVQKIQSSERRLNESGLFYRCEIIIVPPRLNPDKRTILIKASPGFLWRFNGGSAYAAIGRKALQGRRNFLWGYAGYNHIGLFFRDENLLQKNFILETGILYSNNYFESQTLIHRIDGSILLGYRIHPDLSFQVNSNLTLILNSEDIVSTPNIWEAPGLYFSETPSLRHLRYFGRDGTLLSQMGAHMSFAKNSSSNLVIFGKMIGKTNMFSIRDRLSGSLELNYPILTPYFTEAYSIDLFIRAPLSNPNESFEALWAASIEYGRDVLRFTTAGISLTRVMPFAFFDIGAGTTRDRLFLRESLNIGFGPGLKVIFEKPIDISAVLTYGFNAQGKGQLNFHVRGEI